MSSVASKTPTIAEKVKTIIHEKLGVDESAMVDSASFSDDLGLDSLDVLETLMALEKQFNLKINDEDAEKLKTVGSVIDYITTHVRQY
ncbi:MAG TPA: acyl carrier protein [Puia sp.]|nr:acyl carrier protein [Puia sp.]